MGRNTSRIQYEKYSKNICNAFNSARLQSFFIISIVNEFFFISLGRNCPCVQVNLIHSLAVKILDIVYLQKLHIYKLLFDNAKMEFDLKLTNDHLFMASCVIVAAAYILDPDSNDKVCRHTVKQQSTTFHRFNLVSSVLLVSGDSDFVD